MTVSHPYLSILTQIVKMRYLKYFWHYSEMEKAVCVRGSISDFEEVSSATRQRPALWPDCETT